MAISILRNDAYRALAVSTSTPETQLEGKILKVLIEQGIIYSSTEDAGKKIEEVVVQEGYTPLELFKMIFPNKPHEEAMEFLGALVFWGDAVVDPCPDCGCEIQSKNHVEMYCEWTEKKCMNPECEYAETIGSTMNLLEPSKEN